MNNRKEVLIEIDNVRIIRNDPLNLTVERLETNYSNRHKKEFTSYQFKGYYSTILGALRGIMFNELLVDEKSLTDLGSYLNMVEESNSKIKEVLNGFSEEDFKAKKINVITEELLDEGSPFENNIIEAWSDARKGFDRMAELQKNGEDGLAYQITAVEVKG